MGDKAYSYEDLGDLKGRILNTCERVRSENPRAWKDAHNGNFDETSTRYNDLCVQALRAEGIFAGCNGKRGGDQRSDDVLAFGLSDNRGAQDRSGRFRSMAIIDYIGGAGGPNPSIGWSDVSSAAPGKFLDPQGLARIDGGTPAPTPTPQPPTPPPQPQPPTTPDPNIPPPGDDMDIRTLNAKLDAVLANQEAAKHQQAADTGQVGTWMVEQSGGVVSSILGGIREMLNGLCKYKSGGGFFRGASSGGDDPEKPEQSA